MACLSVYTVTYASTLQDAENRGRSGASTFQLLANAAALMFACKAVALLDVGMRLAAAVTAVLSLLTLMYIYKSRKYKKA